MTLLFVLSDGRQVSKDHGNMPVPRVGDQVRIQVNHGPNGGWRDWQATVIMVTWVYTEDPAYVKIYL